MINKDNLDEMLEYAIVEEGAKAHLQEYEQMKRMAFNRRIRTSYLIAKGIDANRIRTISYSAAACLALVACTTGYLGLDARKVGYSYEFPAGVRGTSEIEALMDQKDNKAALIKIEEAKAWLAEEKKEPMSDDPIYMDSLDSQEQELDFLEAVCQLRRGHFFSGKRALQRVAEEGGIYAEKAKELIDKL